MHDTDHKERVRIRSLELISLCSEDWGKVVENTNDFIFKGWNRESAEAALEEIQKLKSPLHELEANLVIEITKLLHEEKEGKVTHGEKE